MEKHLERDVDEEAPRHEDVSTTIIETSGLKRDLSSRHINMIAIAGMIVSLHIHILKKIVIIGTDRVLSRAIIGYRSFSRLWASNCNCGAGRGPVGVHCDGICHGWSFVHNG